MKLITLNIWGGSLHKELIAFFKKHQDVDVFLLQEVFHKGTEKTVWQKRERAEIFSEIGEALPDHQGFYAPAQDDEWGLAAFVRKSLSVTEAGDVFVYRTRDAMVGRDGATVGKNLQYLKIEGGGKKFTALNFHGLWTGKGKSDTEGRLSQSKKIIDFAKGISGDVVLAGDFNLLPDTESLKMIERELGLRNLVVEHKVTSTRTSHYTKPEKFADYIFVSPSLRTRGFKVLPEEVSDHAALFVEF